MNTLERQLLREVRPDGGRRQVARRRLSVPDDNKGYQKLRAIAGLIPSIDGNGTRGAIESGLRNHEDSHAVLDAFATVEAQERGEARSADGDEA